MHKNISDVSQNLMREFSEKIFNVIWETRRDGFGNLEVFEDSKSWFFPQMLMRDALESLDNTI